LSNLGLQTVLRTYLIVGSGLPLIAFVHQTTQVEDFYQEFSTRRETMI